MNFFYFCGSFLPSWIRIRIRIQITDPDPDPRFELNTDPDPDPQPWSEGHHFDPDSDPTGFDLLQKNLKFFLSIYGLQWFNLLISTYLHISLENMSKKS
jgi:hypothetical protein